MTTKTSVRSAQPIAPPLAAALGEESLWARRAEKALADLAGCGRPFTSADLVKSVGLPPSGNLLPALVRAAHRRGLIVRDEKAPLGTVWVGAEPAPRPERTVPGRRRTDRSGTPLGGALWRALQDAACREKVTPEELLDRALREYLKHRR